MTKSETLRNLDPNTVYNVTFADQRKVGGRYVTDGTRTETGTVQVIRDGGAVVVNDPTTGRMLVMVAGGMVQTVTAAR